MTFTRHLDDILVPRITLDLTPSTHHATGAHNVREILLLHCLARLHRSALTPLEAGVPAWAICAGALCLVRACQELAPTQLNSAPHMPANATAGWTRLRYIWPQLPPTPFLTGTK
jgi:hypothetical protein